MKMQTNISLKEFTSFGVGGAAEQYLKVASSKDLVSTLQNNDLRPDWVLAGGTNVLISDKGLPGLTLHLSGGEIELDDDLIVADAGASWDDLVQASIDHNLWGIEFMSGVPGTVGAATFINISAYGQSAGENIEWVEAWDTKHNELLTFNRSDLQWDYKESIFQRPENKDLIIVRVAFKLATKPTHKLEYQSALDAAEELGLEPISLQSRRQIIMKARDITGSLFNFKPKDEKTVGSFFRNPTVDQAIADKVIAFDEKQKTKQQWKKMNQVHGGNTQRVSAALVLLAAGFNRGQEWGQVKLNDKNLLKIQNKGDATAQQIYDVAMHIQKTVRKELNVELRAEAQILGDFDNPLLPAT